MERGKPLERETQTLVGELHTRKLNQVWGRDVRISQIDDYYLQFCSWKFASTKHGL